MAGPQSLPKTSAASILLPMAPSANAVPLPKRSPRQVELDVRAVMEATVAGDGGIAALILHRSPENIETLLALRDFMLNEINRDLAMTDPSLYRKLSRLRMEMTLRGWQHYFWGAQ